ncbi:MAG: DNA repair protein RadA [Alphaproteobacteria bacterium]
MPRPRATYVCTACGAVSARWAGRCEACGEWNTIEEEAARAGEAAPNVSLASGGAVTGGRKLEFSSLEGRTEDTPRRATGIAELDRVLGGGLVPGSVVLVGGDPGFGKSTLLLQAGARLAQAGTATAYVSGEEAEAQVRLRAARLDLESAPVRLAAATNLRDILTSIEAEKPDVVVIDSIQTMWSDALESAPGTVAQLRACVHDLVRFAKRRGTSVILVGHVTKDGQIAGPRVIEHMVDTVLYFEGERSVHFRILRAVKNRFGPTDEIGVFEMTGGGLAEVANPSELFLGEREGGAAGACVFAGIEGTRPVLVEIQALVAPTHFGTPRRAVVGWDAGRLAMVIAVLDARCGLSLSTHDVYLNVAGGLRITEPAADLAVSAALTSALLGIALPRETVVFGEVSLSGAVRPVPQAESRLKEAAKLGFRQAIAPARAKGAEAAPSLPLTPVKALHEVSALIREGLSISGQSLL